MQTTKHFKKCFGNQNYLNDSSWFLREKCLDSTRSLVFGTSCKLNLLNNKSITSNSRYLVYDYYPNTFKYKNAHFEKQETFLIAWHIPISVTQERQRHFFAYDLWETRICAWNSWNFLLLACTSCPFFELVHTTLSAVTYRIKTNLDSPVGNLMEIKPWRIVKMRKTISATFYVEQINSIIQIHFAQIASRTCECMHHCARHRSYY